MRKQFDSASCPNCYTFFDRLPVEYDEDGGYVFLEVHPCPACGTMLCPCCDQFHCDGCGQAFCADHLVSIPELTGPPMHCCPPCAAECEVEEVLGPLPPGSERCPLRPAEAA